MDRTAGLGPLHKAALAMVDDLRQMTGLADLEDYPPDDVNEWPVVRWYPSIGATTGAIHSGRSGRPRWQTPNQITFVYEFQCGDEADGVRLALTAYEEMKRLLIAAFLRDRFDNTVEQLTQISSSSFGWSTAGDQANMKLFSVNLVADIVTTEEAEILPRSLRT